MSDSKENFWKIGLSDPVEGRLEKPRNSGLTMVIDKGLGLNEIKDLLEVSSSYIDFVKFSFGTPLIYPEKILKEKIKIIKEYQLDVYPGGTLFEIAITQNRLEDFLFRTRHLGFTAVEISNGTIYLSPEVRKEAIFKARSLGFKVLTEVGKKDRNNDLSPTEMKKAIETDLNSGADFIIIEGRESGKAISIYDNEGNVDYEMLNVITSAARDAGEKLIWEAPLKKQQVFFINKIGPNVSLGNIQPGDALALEALRRGLRGDTLKNTLGREYIEYRSEKDRGSIVGA